MKTKLLLGLALVLSGCASTRPPLTLAHNIQIPKVWSAGSESPGMPDCGTAERYVSAYDRGWWIMVQNFAADINFSDPSPFVMSGWAEEAAGAQAGYVTARDRIEELIRIYGKQKVSEYLQQFRLPDDLLPNASNAATTNLDDKPPKMITDKEGVRYRLLAPVSIQQAIDADNDEARRLHLFNQGLQQRFSGNKALVNYLLKVDERYGQMHAGRIQKLKCIADDLKQSGGELYHYESFNADFNADLVNTNAPAGATNTDEGWLILSGGKIYRKY